MTPCRPNSPNRPHDSYKLQKNPVSSSLHLAEVNASLQPLASEPRLLLLVTEYAMGHSSLPTNQSRACVIL